MKGPYSFNDRLILCANLEISWNWYFLWDVFSAAHGMQKSLHRFIHITTRKMADCCRCLTLRQNLCDWISDNWVCAGITKIGFEIKYEIEGQGQSSLKLRRILIVLTLNVRGPSYLSLTRSISWQLMPWLLTSPGHQQPWYWLCKINKSLSCLRKNFNYLRRINVEKWHKM